MGKNYQRTISGCFLGIANQAVITNITAVLFVHFMSLYQFQLWQLGVLIGVNFACQMAADIVLTFLIDKVGFRILALFATVISTAGLIAYGILPFTIPVENMFAAIVVVTTIFAFASGMCEVLLSPIIDNIPENIQSKKTAMSLMHSFYAWGQVFCVVITALFLKIAGSANWGYVVIFFALLPIAAFILFKNAPFDKREIVQGNDNARKILHSSAFWVALFAILFGGASEVLMNQWVSTFLVKGLSIDKTTADLWGMALFAFCIGIGRGVYGKFGEKWDLHRILVVSSLISFILFLITGMTQQGWLAILASVLSGLTVSLLWPGTLSITSNRFPMAGAWIFAVLAIFGDTGAMIFPAAGGFVSEYFGLGTMFIIMSAAPLCAFFCHIFLWKKSKNVV